MTVPTLLVTGGSGFIGTALLDLIKREGFDRSYRVVLLSTRDNPDWETIVDRRLEDGLYRFTPESFKGRGITNVDYLIHLGAFTPKEALESQDVAGCISNIQNTRHLVVNLPNAPRRIIFASSIDVYGPVEGNITEEVICCPRSLYGLSKLFCERIISSLLLSERFSRTYLQILRVGHTYGPGEQGYRKFIPVAIQRLIDGKAPHFFTDGSERRSFIHVDDCTRLILAALTSPPDIGPINLASETALSLNTIADYLCHIHAEDGRSPLKPTYEPKPAEGWDVVFDVAKMNRYLGRTRIGIEQGLRSEFLASDAHQ